MTIKEITEVIDDAINTMKLKGFNELYWEDLVRASENLKSIDRAMEVAGLEYVDELCIVLHYLPAYKDEEE